MSGRAPSLEVVPEDSFPRCECLKDLCDRAIPYFQSAIVPAVASGKNVLVVAHGTTSRALVKYLEDVSDEDIMGINIPNGIPFSYELNGEMRAEGPRNYHAPSNVVKEAEEKAASIGSQ